MAVSRSVGFRSLPLRFFMNGMAILFLSNLRSIRRRILSSTWPPVPVRFSGFLAGYPVPGFRSRSGFRVSWPVIWYLASGPGLVFRLAGRLSSGFRSRSGFPAGRLVIRCPASVPGPVFRLAGRLSGIQLPVPLTTTVGVLCWDNQKN